MKDLEVLEGVPFSGESFVPEFVEFLKPGEQYITGEEMIKRAKEKSALPGKSHADWLLQNQLLIPTEQRKHYLVFPGTRLKDSEDNLCVPGLYWSGNEWYMSSCKLGSVEGLNHRDRLVRMKPAE